MLPAAPSPGETAGSPRDLETPAAAAASSAAAGALIDVPNTLPPAPAASQADAAGPQLVEVGNKTFAFYGDLVCGVCSA